jgi:hypothetical protein
MRSLPSVENARSRAGPREVPNSDSNPEEKLARVWNQNRGSRAAVLVEKLSKDRRAAARARLREEPDLERWSKAARRLTSGYAADKHWADFDFLVRPGNLERIEEGKYDESGPRNVAQSNRIGRSSTRRAEEWDLPDGESSVAESSPDGKPQ